MFRQAEGYLKDWLSNSRRKPLILRGARQVGKSHLVRQFAVGAKLEVIEINCERWPEVNEVFEKNDPKIILEELSRVLNRPLSNIQNKLLFIDEIQSAPAAISALRYFYEEMPDLPVIAAGSLLEFALQNKVKTMPVGRISFLFLGPMSFEEFLLALGKTELLKFLSNYQMGTEVTDLTHNSLLELVKEYVVVGGMPAVVKQYAETHSWEGCHQILSDLAFTYQEDFNKYHGRVPVERLRLIFKAVPGQVGHKFKYSNISRGEKAEQLAKALELLCQAQVCYKVLHSAAGGMPLGAQANEKHFKLLALDSGLMMNTLGVNYQTLRNEPLDFVNDGAIAEQFIGGQLLLSFKEYERPELFYWVREQAGASAEVDYVVNLNSEIIPIEVKAGSGGALRSLHGFMREKKSTRALRFSSAKPLRQKLLAIGETQAKQKTFELTTLPHYLVGQWRRLMR